MTPRRRIVAGTHVFHVTARGNDRQPIFRDARDFLVFLDLLGVVARQRRWRIAAYCLMTNHYHLVVRADAVLLARGLGRLNGGYANHVNRTWRRCGHVFQGRYFARGVDTADYFRAAVRYVLRNPVDAAMVADATQYPWSSAGATLTLRPAPDWLAVEIARAALGRTREEARAVLRTVAEGRPVAIADHDERIGVLRLMLDGARDRDAGIVSAWATGQFTLREIGAAVGLSAASVSRIARNVRSSRRAGRERAAEGGAEGTEEDRDKAPTALEEFGLRE